MTPKPRRQRDKTLPQRLALTLLYGQFTWLLRLPGGVVSFPTHELAAEHRTRSVRVKDALLTLKAWGLLTSLTSRDTVTYLQLRVPPGFERLTNGDVLDI